MDPEKAAEAVEINIADAVSSSSNLFLRSSAVDLFEMIENMPEREIIIDFKNIDFANRAFAHEYLTQKSKSSKMISEVHLSEDVKIMLDIVFKVHHREFEQRYAGL